jgi:DNA-3-methyladenine glycosylase II
VTTPLTATEVERAAAHLARRDPDLRRLLDEHGPPPLWGRREGFATLVHIILEQQVSLASARAVLARLRRKAGRITPRRLLDLGERRLGASGLTRQKQAYCLHLARALEGGTLDLVTIRRLDDAEASALLQSLPGIGPWTAQIYLLMALRRPDIWPAGDLALAESVRVVKGLRARPSPERLARIAEPWRPYRAVAARMLWQRYLAAAARRRSDA